MISIAVRPQVVSERRSWNTSGCWLIQICTRYVFSCPGCRRWVLLPAPFLPECPIIALPCGRQCVVKGQAKVFGGRVVRSRFMFAPCVSSVCVERCWPRAADCVPTCAFERPYCQNRPALKTTNARFWCERAFLSVCIICCACVGGWVGVGGRARAGFRGSLGTRGGALAVAR